MIKFDQPNLQERYHFFQDFIFQKDIPCENISAQSFSKLSTNRYSLRDLKNLILDAKRLAFKSAWKSKHFRPIDTIDNTTEYIGCNCKDMLCGAMEINVKDIHHP